MAHMGHPGTSIDWGTSFYISNVISFRSVGVGVKDNSKGKIDPENQANLIIFLV
jgi:hypothetical protein